MSKCVCGHVDVSYCKHTYLSLSLPVCVRCSGVYGRIADRWMLHIKLSKQRDCAVNENVWRRPDTKHSSAAREQSSTVTSTWTRSVSVSLQEFLWA